MCLKPSKEAYYYSKVSAATDARISITSTAEQIRNKNIPADFAFSPARN